MWKIYEIRCKSTHRIEYLNLYIEGEQSPEEAFGANPDRQHFQGRLDLYINVRSEAFDSKDKAWAYCMNLWVKYKLMPPEKLQENIETPKVLDKPKTKKR